VPIPLAPLPHDAQGGSECFAPSILAYERWYGKLTILRQSFGYAIRSKYSLKEPSGVLGLSYSTISVIALCIDEEEKQRKRRADPRVPELGTVSLKSA